MTRSPRTTPARSAVAPAGEDPPLDFLPSLGALALTARLKRLTDRMLHDARALYEQLGLDIEPGWHLMFLLLEARGPLSVTDITVALGVAHPSVVATTTKMIERGYLSAQPDPQDGRSRRLRLSARGRATLEACKPIWEASRRGLDGLIAETGVDVLALVTALERGLDAKDYRDRTLNARGTSARRRCPTRRTRADR